MDIILASSSPRRKELLSNIFKNFYIVPSNIDEESIVSQEKDPEKVVRELSFRKADHIFSKALYQSSNEGIVIGADTIVCFDNAIIGKPSNKEDAIRTLQKLQGNSNDVYTGMTIYIKKKHSIIAQTVVTKSTVYFKPMSYQDILDYVATKEPLDKAGSYAIQGLGRQYIKGYDGNYNAILGLNTDQLNDILDRYHIVE